MSVRKIWTGKRFYRIIIQNNTERTQYDYQNKEERKTERCEEAFHAYRAPGRNSNYRNFSRNASACSE